MSEIENKNNTDYEKHAVTYGVLTSNKKFFENYLIPDKVKNKIKNTKYYLLIFIPGEAQAKLNIFPIESADPDVRKVFIKMEEFPPEVIKSISDIINEFNLKEKIIHISGVCFQQDNCYYEYYMDFKNISKDIIENLKNRLIENEKILNIKIINLENKF
ncbi:MAG: hypothetical protein ACTSU2_15420 [Promethearchaeota archaeon]